MGEVIVSVNEGKLRGQYEESVNGIGYYAFKGVPFAKPPVGELRFAAPQPPEFWEGVRDATKTPNVCYQNEFGNIHGSEDCLYLNVLTPKLATAGAKALPVILFIHGGGFVGGNGVDGNHTPDFMLEKDVVFVSFNYRLGILGFLSLDRKEAPGNMGLKDQVQALKWVKKNISNFNGDPNNITILGVSAGASSVEYLLLSPMARGLFQKAISQAGSTLSPWAKNNNIKRLACKIPQAKGVTVTNDDELYEYLKKMPVHDLVTTSVAVIAAEESKGGIFFGFVPTIEQPGDWEPFLKENPYELLKKGEFQQVPYLTGTCSHEGLLIIALNNSKFETLGKEKNFLSYLPFNIVDSDKADIEAKLATAYLNDNKEANTSDDFAINFFTDVDFLGGVSVAAKLIAKKSSPVYFYQFCYDGNLNYVKKLLNIKRPGACHADDGGYNLKGDLVKDPSATKTDILVKDRMIAMWTNFVKFGNPTPSIEGVITTKWEPVDEKGLKYLRIDEDLTLGSDLHPKRLKLYEELYEKYFDKV